MLTTDDDQHVRIRRPGLAARAPARGWLHAAGVVGRQEDRNRPARGIGRQGGENRPGRGREGRSDVR